MQKLVMAISIIIAMFYALSAQAIGPERDIPTAIVTLEQITTPSNPSAGFNRIYSKGDDKLYTLNSAGEEVELGAGGAGSGRLNLLEDPSFEDGVAEGSCSGCTASEELVEVLATLNNAKSLEMAYSAATGCYTVTKTTSAQYTATQMAGSCFVKTSAADVTFEAMVNGVSVLSKEVSSSDSWKEYTHAFVGGATSVGYRVCANTSITDSIFVDECFLGAKDVLNKVGYDTGWEDAGVISIGATITAPTKGTTSVDRVQCMRNGENLKVRYTFIGATAGTAGSGDYIYDIPSSCLNGSQVNISKVVPFTGSSQNGGDDDFIGSYIKSNGAISDGGSVNRGEISAYLYDENSFRVIAELVYSSYAPHGSGLYSYANANLSWTLEIEVPIQGWQATFDSISEVGGGSNVRLDTANGYGSTATRIRRFSNERVNIGSGLNCVDSATNGFSCTVLRSGFYFISYTDNFVNANVAGISLNASSLTTNINALPASEVLAMQDSYAVEARANPSWAGWLWTGDIVRPHTHGAAASSNTYAQFSMVGLLDQINAILKDVVMSPNSSNGKPVMVSAEISTTGVVSQQVGDWITGSCTVANPVSTCNITGFSEPPNCSFTFIDEGLGVLMAKAGISTSTQLRFVTQLSAANTWQAGRVSVVCHGVRP